MEDRELVKKVQAGNREAFAVFIERYKRLVAHMVARLIDNQEDREEAIQDIFVRIYQNIGTFNFDSKLSTWVGTIAYRHAINVLKKKKRMPASEEIVESDAMVLEEDFENMDRATFINKCIDKLPDHYKVILTLYHLDQMSYPEIVEITGMPEGTVKNYLFRARKKLKDILEPYLKTEMLQ